MTAVYGLHQMTMQLRAYEISCIGLYLTTHTYIHMHMYRLIPRVPSMCGNHGGRSSHVCNNCMRAEGTRSLGTRLYIVYMYIQYVQTVYLCICTYMAGQYMHACMYMYIPKAKFDNRPGRATYMYI